MSLEINAEKIFDPAFKFAAVAGHKAITVKFAEVEYINSQSIRLMIMWVREVNKLEPDVKLTFTHVPAMTYRQLLMFTSTLPATLLVSSLYVPFFCDDCSLDHFSFYEASALANANPETAFLPLPLCKSCRKPMDADISAQNFFQLLQPNRQA